MATATRNRDHSAERRVSDVPPDARRGRVKPPANLEAERSVLGKVMAGGPKVAGEVIGAILEDQHFYEPSHKMIYGQIIESYFSDDPIDALSVGERLAPKLARAWRISENEAIVRVRDMAVGYSSDSGTVIDHAKIVKRESDLRELLEVSAR